MNDSREVNYNGTNTSDKWHWYYNRILLNCLGLAFACFIGDLCLRRYYSGSDVFDILYLLLDNVLITIITACTIGILWEVSGKNDLIQEIQQHTDKSLQEAGLSNTLADQGILHTTTDFEQEIPWKNYIANADEIDVCWWAGLGWVQRHRPTIETTANKNKLRIRYVIPDAGNDNILTQMTAISGIKSEQLKESYTSVCEELQPLGKIVELHKIKKLPQYGMVRLGSRIVFFPYSHLRGRPIGRPTFVIDSNSELGERFMRDFEELLRDNEESSS